MIPATRVLEAAGRALTGLAPGTAPASFDRVVRELRRRGIPAPLAKDVLRLLDAAGLIAQDGVRSSLAVTDAGRLAGTALANGDWGPFAEALCSLDDVRRRLDSNVLDLDQRDDRMVVRVSEARRRAPDLAVIFSWLPMVDGEPDLALLPAAWLETMILVDQADSPRDWVVRNAAVGMRAERYSLHLARSQHPASRVLWIAAESDRLGYDLEIRTISSMTAVEVKGSTRTEVRFFLSAKEREAATRLGTDYVLQFWGGIDLSAPALFDYQRLRAEGYPIEFTSLSTSLEQGVLEAKAVNWEITRPSPLQE